jgi:hypothetical protein
MDKSGVVESEEHPNAFSFLTCGLFSISHVLPQKARLGFSPRETTNQDFLDICMLSTNSHFQKLVQGPESICS